MPSDTTNNQAQNQTRSSLQVSSDFLSAFGLRGQDLVFGLSYTKTMVDKSGLINAIKKKQQPLDIDIACLLFDKSGAHLESVWFKNLRDTSSAIRHHGDSLSGYQPKPAEQDAPNSQNPDANQPPSNNPVTSSASQDWALALKPPKDEEWMTLALNKLPAGVHHISLIVSTFQQQPLKQANTGDIHLSDDEGTRAFQLDLRKLDDGCSALWVANLSREVDDWRLTIQKSALPAQPLPELAKLIEHELSRGLKPVTVNTLTNKALADKTA